MTISYENAKIRLTFCFKFLNGKFILLFKKYLRKYKDEIPTGNILNGWEENIYV